MISIRICKRAKKRKLVNLIVSIYSTLLLANNNLNAREPITLITEEWPPYNYVENRIIKGISTEIVQLVMKDLGVNDEIIVLPSARARVKLDSTPRSMLYSFILTPERKPLFHWIGPLAEQSIYFYSTKGSKIHVQSLEEAKQVRSVCCRDSGLVYEMLVKAGFKNLEVSVGAESIYLKALNGRCDLAISETHLGLMHLLKKINLPNDAFKQTPVKLISSPLYIVANKSIPLSEVKQWQESLEKVKKSKEYLEIHDRFNGLK